MYFKLQKFRHILYCLEVCFYLLWLLKYASAVSVEIFIIFLLLSLLTAEIASCESLLLFFPGVFFA